MFTKPFIYQGISYRGGHNHKLISLKFLRTDLICLEGLLSFEIWNFLQGLWGSTVLGVCTDFIRNFWNDVARKLLAIFVGMCKGVCRANVLVQVCNWTAIHFVSQDHLLRFIAWLDYQKVVSVGSGPRSSDLDLSSQCDGHTCHGWMTVRMAFSWQSCWRLSWGFHVASRQPSSECPNMSRMEALKIPEPFTRHARELLSKATVTDLQKHFESRSWDKSRMCELMVELLELFPLYYTFFK